MKTSLVALSAAVALAVVPLAACGGGSSSSSSSSSSSGKTVAGQLVLGSSPEFKTRPDGIPGLKRLYGVTFGGYKTTDPGGTVSVTSLKNGQVQATDLFTTDPSLKANHFVVLKDPKNLYVAQNVLPLVNKAKATPGVTEVLNAVSAKLTTSDLIDLNTQVEVDKKDPDAVAKAWLEKKGLDATGTKAQGSTLTVGSANFSESSTLAEIYAEALKAQGANVSTKLNIGARATYVPGLKDGSIDLIPEYSGALLQYFDASASAQSSSDVLAALQKAVPAGLTVLQQSDAQDKDTITVTAATARKYHLSSIGDLAKKS